MVRLPSGPSGCRATTPEPEVGPTELFEYWPVVVRLGWFLAGLLAVVLLNRIFIQPVLERVLRQRNHNNPTLRNALLRYFQIVAIVIAILVGASVAGYGPYSATPHSSSALSRWRSASQPRR